MWTFWKRYADNSTASHYLPKGIDADRLACANIEERHEKHHPTACGNWQGDRWKGRNGE
jgi:hypothetical protein